MLNSSVLLTIAPLLHGRSFSLSFYGAPAPVTTEQRFTAYLLNMAIRLAKHLLCGEVHSESSRFAGTTASLLTRMTLHLHSFHFHSSDCWTLTALVTLLNMDVRAGRHFLRKSISCLRRHNMI